VLLIHIDNSKTYKRFAKKRKVFSRLGVFIKYELGIVVCKVITKTEDEFNKPISIPIYYTKFLSTSIEYIPLEYQTLIF
jgi:hypothetical protein